MEYEEYETRTTEEWLAVVVSVSRCRGTGRDDGAGVIPGSHARDEWGAWGKGEEGMFSAERSKTAIGRGEGPCPGPCLPRRRGGGLAAV